MAATTSEKTRSNGTDSNLWWSKELYGVETATHAFRELAGLQMRTARAMMDQGAHYSKKAAEHFHHQLEEGVKLTQDTMKYGLGLMEDYRKVVSESLEKTLKPE